jgi:uncharacterized protein YkwD
MGRDGISRGFAAAVAAAVLVAGTGWAQRPSRTRVADEDVTRPVHLTEEEQEIFTRTNEYRAKCGLPKVTLNPQLTRAARYFAIYMALTGSFDHDADGKGPGARAAKFGYNWSLVCENIAYRYKAYDTSMRDLPSDFVEGWIRSAGHRKNMLCDEVIETGVGVAVGKNPRHQYSVQVFGKPRGRVYRFKVVNDSRGLVRYVLGRQVFTLRPGHTRVHPDSEAYPTYFESQAREGGYKPVPMQKRDAPAASYRILPERGGGGGVSVVSGPS